MMGRYQDSWWNLPSILQEVNRPSLKIQNHRALPRINGRKNVNNRSRNNEKDDGEIPEECSEIGGRGPLGTIGEGRFLKELQNAPFRIEFELPIAEPKSSFRLRSGQKMEDLMGSPPTLP
jgi:hypothetical protein